MVRISCSGMPPNPEYGGAPVYFVPLSASESKHILTSQEYNTLVDFAKNSGGESLCIYAIAGTRLNINSGKIPYLEYRKQEAFRVRE